jgi:hypothetical protein
MHREIDASSEFRRKIFAMAIKRSIVEDISDVVRWAPGGGNSSEPRWAHEGSAKTIALNRLSLR